MSKAIEYTERAPKLAGNRNYTNICRCNNCMQYFIDTNPQSDARIYEVSSANLSTLVPIADGYEIIYACPFCKTDDYLIDI